MVNKAYTYRCKDGIGGVKSLYLANHIVHSRKQIEVVSGELISYPNQIIYKFDTLQGASFTENYQDGNYNQTITANFIKSGESVLDSLVKCPLIAIVEDNNGKFHFVGLYNGLEATLNKQTGASKQEQNGYQLTLNGAERYTAPFGYNLDEFNLFNNVYNYLLDNNSNFLTDSNNNRLTHI